MDLNATQAVLGYARGKPATAPSEAGGGAAFTEALSRAAGNFAQTLARGDAAAAAAMTGQGSSHDLVTALAQSQLAVETAVAVRNKVIEAYQELLRMPV